MPSIEPRFRLNAGVLAWICMFAGILNWGIGHVPTGALGNVGNYYRIALVGSAGSLVLLGLLWNAGRLSRSWSWPLFLFCIYAAVAAISALYLPAHALYSMWKSVEIAIDVLAVAVILASSRSRDSALAAYNVIIFSFVALLILYLLEATMFPSQAFRDTRGLLPFMLQGLMPIKNPNGVGAMAAMVGIASFSRLLRTRRPAGKSLWLFIFASALIALILAQSRTSLAGFAIALCVYLYFDRRTNIFVFLAVFITGAIALFPEITGLGERYAARGQSTELMLSLSGRMFAWEQAWGTIKQSPWIGHGFVAFARAEILGLSGASTLHGSAFDVLIGVGILGFIPWLAAVLWASTRVFKLVRFRAHRSTEMSGRAFHAELLAILTILLIRATTSSALAMHEHEFMLFLAILAYAESTRFSMTSQPGSATEKLAAGVTRHA